MSGERIHRELMRYDRESVEGALEYNERGVGTDAIAQLGAGTGVIR